MRGTYFLLFIVAQMTCGYLSQLYIFYRSLRCSLGLIKNWRTFRLSHTYTFPQGGAAAAIGIGKAETELAKTEGSFPMVGP
jgi:hypothetical protein